MKLIGRLILLITITLISCEDDSDSLDTKTNLIVDVNWYNSEIVGTPMTGYSAVSPIIFKRDNKVYIGGNQAKWSFIDNGQAIKITNSSDNYSNKYLIQNLTSTEFHFKHYDTSGNYLAELKYNKCNPLSIDPC